jgi:y4mF family transcriptional regulator
MRDNVIANFVRTERKKMGYTQEELALFSGLSLHFIQNLEQGKESLQLNKVNELLEFLGAKLDVKVGR